MEIKDEIYLDFRLLKCPFYKGFRTLRLLNFSPENSSENTIFDELLTVKQELLDTERKMRSLELQMKSLSGDELETALKTYTNLTHQFEQENGYACKSEITGVLKGLGFDENDFKKPISTLSGGQKTRVSLGKLLLSKPDIILLDEPTNHLDILSAGWKITFQITTAP